jgi:hypothetical protein
MNRRQANRVAFTIFLLFSAGYPINALCTQRESAGPTADVAANLPADIGEVLWWVPPKSETLIVSRLSRTVKRQRPDDHAPTTLEEESKTTSLGSLAEVRNGSLVVPLVGEQVVLEVEASRTFRPPMGIGPTRFNGIELYKFRGPLGQIGARLVRVLKENANRLETIEGVDVAVFEEMIERTPWTFHVTYLEPNLVLCAADRDSLVETLQRRVSRRGARPFPPSLPEWKYIDKEASIWAIRHFESGQVSSPLSGAPTPTATIPDSQAIGLVFYCDLQKEKIAHLVYLSRSVASLETFRSLAFRVSTGLTPSAKRLDTQTIKVDFPLEKIDTQSLCDLFSRVHWLLGHEVSL